MVKRIAEQTMARRGLDYEGEVRRLIDAAILVMRERGTTSRPRVSDIVAAAGLSNDAFYRHFASKDQLVRAILEDGTERLCSYVVHQMEKAPQPEAKVRAWIAGVLSQANPDIAATTLAVLYNGGGVAQGLAPGRHFASEPLGALLHEPFAALGSATPELHASLVAHAVFGSLSDFLWQSTTPSDVDIETIATFFIRAVARS